jgi:cell shape-determining protein MreC
MTEEQALASRRLSGKHVKIVKNKAHVLLLASEDNSLLGRAQQNAQWIWSAE